MKIKQVKVVDAVKNNIQTFILNNATSAKPCLASGANVMDNLRFCFGDNTASVNQVVVTIDIDNQQYQLNRWHEGNHVYSELTANDMIIAYDDDALDYIGQLVGFNVLDLFTTVFDGDDVSQFNGSLHAVPAMQSLISIIENATANTASLIKQRNSVNLSASTLMQNTPVMVTKSEVEELDTKLEEINIEIDKLSAKELELQLKGSAMGANDNVLMHLRQSQLQYDELIKHDNEINKDREELNRLTKLKDIIPKLNRVRSLEQQQKEVDSDRHKLVAELEWQEKELADVVSRIELTTYNVATVSDKRNVLTSVNHEVGVINKLSAQNEQYSAQLEEIKKQHQQLTFDRVSARNKLLEIESQMSDTNQAIEQFQQSGQSVNDLIELARVQAQIDEISQQIMVIADEIADSEQSVALRETSLTAIKKNYKQIVELDKSASSIKAKDTILQVLDAKYNKINTMNNHFKQKEHNLRRVLEDYNYQKLEIENSERLLNKRLQKEKAKFGDKTNFQLYGKQDVTAIQAIMNELEHRNATRLSLLTKSSRIEGKLEEVARFIAINNADLAMLDKEKSNIISRYNELTSLVDRHEPAYQYVKALETNNGTNYLLDVQRSSVSVEIELSEAKKHLNSNRNKLSVLKARLAQAETIRDKQIADGWDGTVLSNDALRNQLAELGQHIADGFSQQQELSNQIEQYDIQLNQVKANMFDYSKNIEINTNRIQLARDNIASYAGEENADKAIDNLHYELADIDAERNILLESRRDIERKVFDKRIQLEKLAYVSTSKANELQTLRDEIKLDVSVADIDIKNINLNNYKADMDRLSKSVNEHDTARQVLAHRIDNYSAIIGADTSDSVMMEYVDELSLVENQLADLRSERALLQQEHKDKLLAYLSNGDTRMQYAVVATEAQSIPTINQAIENSQIVEALMTDKVSDILRRATLLLNEVTEDKYILQYNSGDLAINCNGDIVMYRDLSDKLKWALYLAIIMAMPNENKLNSRWITLGDSVPYSEEELQSMLSVLGDSIYYVTNYYVEELNYVIPTVEGC